VVAVLVLIGAPGAGKSSVLEELATLHDIHAIDHGALEAEQLSLGRPLLPASRWVPQLEAVLSLQREAGRRRFLISATVEAAEDLRAVRGATAAELLLVACLTASPATVSSRIDAREPDRWPGKRPLIARASARVRCSPPAGHRHAHRHRTPRRIRRCPRDPRSDAARGDARALRVSVARPAGR
jgi:hypothetical protein